VRVPSFPREGFAVAPFRKTTPVNEAKDCRISERDALIASRLQQISHRRIKA
jgi:hypothetical protein